MKNIALLFVLALLSGCASHSARYESRVEDVYWVQPPVVQGYVVHEYYDARPVFRHENRHYVPPPPPRNPPPPKPAPRFAAHPVPPVAPMPQAPHFSQGNQHGNLGANHKGNPPPARHVVPPKPALKPAPADVAEGRANFQNHQQAPASHKPTLNERSKPAPSATFGGGSAKPNHQVGGNRANERPAMQALQAPRPSDSGANRVGKPASDKAGKFSKQH